MKKFLILCFTAVILLAAVTGSIAYFTDSVVSEENVIASGSIDVLQHEYERVKNADGTYTLRAFTQKQNLYPCVKGAENRVLVQVGNATVQMYDESVQNFIDKIVTVENSGKNVAYVRTFVAVPALADGINWLHLDCNTTDWTWQHEVLTNVHIDNLIYDIHVATHNQPLTAGAVTSPSLLGFYMDSRVSNDNDHLVYIDQNNVKHDLGNNPSLTILVATEASQSYPFDNAAQALDITFGSVTADQHHPWQDIITVASQADLDKALAQAKYDTVIALMNGEYTLPAELNDGIRIVGWESEVKVSAGAISAYDVEFDNFTFVSDVSFTGHGSFQDVVFEGKLTSATFNNVSMFDHCTFAVTPASSILSSPYLTVSECTYLDVAP